MREHGVVVEGLQSTPTAMFIEAANIIADDDANTKIYGTIGASATLSCQECKNVLNAYNQHRSKHSDCFVDICCSDVNLFGICDDSDHWLRADTIAHLAEHGPNYRQQCTLMGVRHLPFGLLAHKELRK